jgi:hypothetical protein
MAKAVCSDITGLNGMKMLEAIVNGERSGEKLASLAHARITGTMERRTTLYPCR